MRSAEWRIEGDVGVLQCGSFVARVEADGRGVRLNLATWQGLASDAFGALITAGPGPRPALIEVQERYVRGCDYVVQYARSAEFPVAPQFYWRAGWHDSFSAAQIQMIVSVQTDLLDSQPEVSISSFAIESRLFEAHEIAAPAFAEIAGATSVSATNAAGREHLIVFRNEALGISYAQMVHPTDFVAAELRSGAGAPPLVRSTLFPESLEKGVIRRARVSGWFLPAANDLAAAVELAKQFVAEPLPLTA